MAIVLNTLDDFIEALETDHDARKRLKFVLFDMDIEESLRELRRSHDDMFRYIRESERRTDKRLSNLESDVSILKDDVSVLKDDVSILKDDVSVLKDDVSILKDDVSSLKRDMGDVKGSGYERDIRDKAAGIFGRIVRRGHDGKNEIMDHLYETDGIRDDEIDQVSATDLIWTGKQRRGGEDVIVVVEVSWLAEPNDVTRAYERAKVIQKSGKNAVPAVAGKVWTQEALTLAEQFDVVVIINTGISPRSLAKLNN